MELKYRGYFSDVLTEILSIDSPVGYTSNITSYLHGKLLNIGYSPVVSNKGDVSVCINPSSGLDNDALWVSAHVDTLGGIVSDITERGSLSISPLGALSPNNTESEIVRVITRSKKIYEGTFQKKNASIHVNPQGEKEVRTFDSMEVVLDEDVYNAGDVIKLGIKVGDIVAFDPRTRLLSNGYIKSRFLDDKLSVAILLYLAYIIRIEHINLNRKVYFGFTTYEEVGHGGSFIPYQDVSEILAVDMGVVGDNINCNEHKVSICVKDSRGPYSYDMISSLIDIAEKKRIDYALDVYPSYSSDADASMIAGLCAKHALIGAGVYASHGYERSHMDGVVNTVNLLLHYFCRTDNVVVDY